MYTGKTKIVFLLFCVFFSLGNVYFIHSFITVILTQKCMYQGHLCYACLKGNITV